MESLFQTCFPQSSFSLTGILTVFLSGEEKELGWGTQIYDMKDWPGDVAFL